MYLRYCFAYQIYPFIYVLMSSKSQSSYEHLFAYIDKNVINFKPTSFISDYEKALRNSLKATFPTAKIKGCWFHYCQALNRNARKITNFSKLLQNKNAKKLFRKFMALPLLKPKHIFESFDLLKTQSQDELSPQHSSTFNRFLIYNVFKPFKLFLTIQIIRNL